MNEVKETQELISEIVEWIKTTPWKADFQTRFERLCDLAEKPCVLAIAGKVKAGKSSFLNSLLGVDLAAVGTTETTATINVFKYGRLKNPDKPVIVYWNDGKDPEEQTKEFIDSLQGYTDEILSKSERIDHLEYIIDDERFKNVTLVDTPGFGSVVEEHENCINSYFNPRRERLRARQIEQSNSLTEKADAVIFISGLVAQANSQQFFGEKIPYISPFNAIGVMAKVDMIQPDSVELRATKEWLDSISVKANDLTRHLSDVFEHELYAVLPVSASLYHSVNKLRDAGKLESYQKLIQLIPKDKFSKRFDQNSEHWGAISGAYHDFYESCGLHYDKRMELSSGMPWKTFCIISIALYYLPLQEAVDYLISLSGMKQVQRVLDQRFFERSRSIRCASVLRDSQQALVEIKNIGLPKLMSDSKSRDVFIKVINAGRSQFDRTMLDSFEVFVEKNIPNMEMVDIFSGKIDSLLVKIDNMLRDLQKIESLSEGQSLLQKNRNLLSQGEINELELLFSGDKNRLQCLSLDDINHYIMFWKGKMLRTNDNGLRHLSKIAYDKYCELL